MMQQEMIPTTTQMVITPELAKTLLNSNKGNRPLNLPHVASLAKKMKEGSWVFTHQGIALDVNGNLLDGQHRLQAIVNANVSVTMLVTTGMAAAHFEHIDVDARKRSAADLLAIRRPDTARNITRTAAIARAAVMYGIEHKDTTYSVQQISQMASDLYEDIATLIDATRPHEAMVPTAVVGAFLNAMRTNDAHPGAKGGIDKAMVLEHVSRLGTWQWLGINDPMMRLHARIVKHRTDKESYGVGVVREKYYALGVAALRAAIEGRTLEKVEATTRDWTSVTSTKNKSKR